MRKRNVFCVLLMCMVLLGSLTANVSAVNVGDEEQVFSLTRASGYFSTNIPGNTYFTADSDFLLDEGETVTIDATYSPRSTSVDFGLIAPDGLFYPVRGQNGSINKTIEIVERGNYTFAIRNNSSVEISVSGFVNY